MTEQQRLDEDCAAQMRHHGHTWAAIAAELGVSVATARRYADASDRRVLERARRDQLSLF